MKKYRANFYDSTSDEMRNITVEAENEQQAEDIACARADEQEWPNHFRLGDVEEID